MAERYYNIPAEKVLQDLASSRRGLTSVEASTRLLRYGPNLLKGKKKTPPVVVFLQQFLSPLIYVLLLAAVISIIAGHVTDALVVFAVLLINAIIGFLQETRAEKAMQALIRMAAPKASVRRDGKVKDIAAREIVPGDILLLETGDKVPADGRLLEATNLKVSEAILTGESVPVDKHTGTLTGELPMPDRKNMVFMGTIVTYGRALSW